MSEVPTSPETLNTVRSHIGELQTATYAFVGALAAKQERETALAHELEQHIGKEFPLQGEYYAVQFDRGERGWVQLNAISHTNRQMKTLAPRPYVIAGFQNSIMRGSRDVLLSPADNDTQRFAVPLPTLRPATEEEIAAQRIIDEEEAARKAADQVVGQASG